MYVNGILKLWIELLSVIHNQYIWKENMNSDSLGQNLPFFVRKLSVIDMEFSDFFDMLWTYLGSPDESKDNKGAS